LKLRKKKEKFNLDLRKKRRLKLLSISTILNYNWTTSHQDTRKLLLLNIFHYLGNSENVETFTNDIKNDIEKLNLITFVKQESLEEVIELYRYYLNWLNLYNSDPKVLKKELNKFSENSIIFNKTYGFALISNFYNSKLVNLETPLGLYDEERNVFGFVEVFIGLQPVFF